ncbi:MAG: glycosyltransferase family 87 protein [Candidatus Tumulicola sp.]
MPNPDKLLVRASAWSIGLALLVELAILPWTAHAFDATAFLSHTDRIYFGHVGLTALWAYGSISLAALLLSQLPVLFFPQLWSAVPFRIFLLKLPAWCADLASAAVIRACSRDRQFANAWALRYLLDPAVVFATVFHGQVDALPNFCTVFGIALVIAEKYELAGLAFGLGAGTKFYPAAFVPLLAVAAYRRASWQRALFALAAFGGASALTLVPVLWGRAGSEFAAYANNSFGHDGVRVSTASLWALLPRGGPVSLAPQAEQFIGIVIPVLLALAELRHLPDRRDIARVAMLTAMSIVLLNPGAHPPFYLWIAGPLVLYAAVADDGMVSLAGFVLSCASIFTQFCQEGSDEYFLMNFGAGPNLGLLRCIAPSAIVQGVVLVSAAMVVVASYRREWFDARTAAVCRWGGQAATLLFFAAFAAAIAAEAVSAASSRAVPAAAFREEERLVNTFAVDPIVRQLPGGRCLLTFAANDVIVYAGNPFAARFATASLGYTLFSPQKIIVGGRLLPVDSLPSTFENIDFRTIGERSVRITRELDVTDALRPFRYVERFVERPCSLIADNPLLIYRFDFAAAQAAAAKMPLLERLNVFAQGGD